MKHATICLLITCGVLFSCDAWAIGDTATNQSVDYLASGGNRHASLEIDAVYANIGGLPFIGEDGFYYMAGNQLAFQTMRIKDVSGGGDGTTYEGDVRSYLFPTLGAAFKWRDLALFLHAGPYGGSGSGDFKDGTPTSSGMAVKIQPAILGFTAGGAYAFTKKISAGLGGRYYYAKTQTRLSNDGETFESEATGFGFGLVAGVDLRPVEKLNIGFQIMWNSDLEVKNETVSSAVGLPGIAGEAYFPDGVEYEAQLPMLATVGVSYQVIERFLRLEVDGLLYFENLNDRGIVEPDPLAPAASKAVAGQDLHDYYGPGFEVGLGAESRVIPKRLTLNAGYMYGRNGQEQKVVDEFNYKLDYHQIGIGGTLHFIEQLNLSFGYLVVFMQKGDKSWDGNQEFNDSAAHFVGLGLKGVFPV